MGLLVGEGIDGDPPIVEPHLEAANGLLVAPVEGVDDDFMAAFQGSMTVYGGCKINLNFASVDQLAWAIRYAVSDADKWKTEGDNYLTMVLPLVDRRFTTSSSLRTSSR